jgi:hypothetical protein
MMLAIKLALGWGLPFILGWVITRQHLNRGRALGALGVLVLLLMEMILTATGILHHQPDLGEVHRWVGHAMVIVAWCVAPYCFAVFSCMWRIHRFTLALVCEWMLVLFTLGLVMHTSFTGYLNVEPVDRFSEETHNRFVVIHAIVEPFFTFVMLAGWLGAIWPRKAEERTSKD